MKQYENYYIYDDPIPYISTYSKKQRELIEEEIKQLKLLSKFDNEQKTKLIQLEQMYNNQVLHIKPVKMLDYLRFYTSVNCISIDKNKIPDPKIINMSYLNFLFHLINNEENGILYWYLLCDLLVLCCGITNLNYKYDENNKVILILEIKQEDESLIIDILDKKDFDNIKNIILKQNIPDYDDTYIDPKVEQVLKEAEEFINRHNKKTCSLEDQIICVLISTPLNLEEIKNLSIRKFTKILQRVDYKLHYEIYKTASMSGFVEFKEEIDHWMSDLSIEKYSNAIVDYDQFNKKMKNVVKQI